MVAYKKGSRTNNESVPTTTKGKPKKTWVVGLINIVNKVFDILKKLLFILYIIVKQILAAFVFLVSIVIKLFVNPNAYCLAAIAVFGFVMVITSYQWVGVGRWAFGFFGITQVLGISVGVLGLCAGTFINLFQMAPELWKISRKFALYYQKNKINPEMDDDEDNDKSPVSRLASWASYNHKSLKHYRRASHFIEIGILITYTLATLSGLQGLVMGLIALICPEHSLKLVSNTIDLMAPVEAAQPQSYESSEEVEQEQYSV